jgi:VWFA-related protein
MKTHSRSGIFSSALPLAAFAAIALLALRLHAQQPQASQAKEQQKPSFLLRVQSGMVLVNVSVRDKKGNFVTGLKPGDFTVLEDGKAQKIVHFDVENVDAVNPAAIEQTNLLSSQPAANARPSAAATVPAPATAQANDPLKDRRLIIFFFDLTSMQPEEIERAVKSAENYVDHQMAPADLVAIASLSTDLTVDQDFTSDRAALKKVLESYSPTSGQGFEEGPTGTTEGTPETGGAFTPDETEYNIFNTDHRLEAIRSIAEQLSHVNEKKSLIYFSSGMDQTGVENESELRATVNAAVRANLAIYTTDMRGLEAMPAGGAAQNASLRGRAAYSGAATLNAINSNFTTQETLVSMADDTGGRAFLDSNDFSQVFRQVQEDTRTYYMLGYQSANHARDGRYRRIAVRVNVPGVKVTYTRGYYAPADFQHTNRAGREEQLNEALVSPLAETDFPMFLATGYFRISQDRYFVPVSLAVPGWDLPITEDKGKDRVSLDVIGWVEDSHQLPFQRIRDTVNLQTTTAQQIRQKNVQYDTGFVLPSGKYHLKLVVREDQTGQMASFETDLNIPDLKSAPMKVSSVVLSNQIQPSKKKVSDDPLMSGGNEIVPSVTHVFSSQQKLYLFYEVYNPGHAPVPAAKGQSQQQAKADKNDIRLLTNAAFYRGNAKVYETPIVEVKQLNTPQRQAADVHLEVPLDKLKPGFYVCQVNIIDDAANRFAFPRLALLVR